MSTQGAANNKKVAKKLAKQSLVVKKIYDEITAAAGAMLAMPDHPMYNDLLARHLASLSSSSVVVKFLSFAHDELKRNSMGLQLTKQFLAQTTENELMLIGTVSQRINFIAFLLETVFPLHDNLDDLKLSLLNLFYEDVNDVFHQIVALIASNNLKLGEYHRYYEIILKYHAVVEKHAPHYKHFLDTILNGQTSDFSNDMLTAAQPAVFQGYANFLKIHGNYAQVCNLFGTRQLGKSAYLESKRLYELLENNLQKIIELAHLNPHSARLVLDETLKPRLTFLKAFYEDGVPTPFIAFLNTLYVFNQDYTHELMCLDACSDTTPGVDKTILDNSIQSLKNAINEASALNEPATVAQSKLESDIFTSVKFKNALISLNLSDVNKAQATMLLPLHRELLMQWRKRFALENTIYAKLVIEKLEMLIRKAISTNLKLGQKMHSASASTSTLAVVATAPQIPQTPWEKSLPFLNNIEAIAKALPADFIPHKSNQEKIELLIRQFNSLDRVLNTDDATSLLQDHLERTVTLCHEIQHFFGDPMLAGLLNVASNLMLSWKNLFSTSGAAPSHEAIITSSRLSELFLLGANRLKPKPETPLVKEELEPVKSTSAPTLVAASSNTAARKISPSKQRRKEQRQLKKSEPSEKIVPQNALPDDIILPEKPALPIIAVQEAIPVATITPVPKNQVKAPQTLANHPIKKPLAPYQLKRLKRLEKERAESAKEVEPHNDESISLISDEVSLSKKEQHQIKKAHKRAVREKAKQEVEKLKQEREKKSLKLSAKKITQNTDINAPETQLISQMAALRIDTADSSPVTIPKPSDIEPPKPALVGTTTSAIPITVDELSDTLNDLKLAPTKRPVSTRAPEFIPKFMPAMPTDRKIKINEVVRNIITILNRRGYYACLVGGAVRDELLGIEPNDFDIVTNCPADKLQEYITDAYRNNDLSQEENNIFQVGDNIDIYCSTHSLEDELILRDMYINALAADRDGLVYDYLGALPQLHFRNLKMIGDVDNRLIEDPKRILRLARTCTHLNKNVSDDYLRAMYQHSPLITTIPFGVYKKDIETLFMRGKGSANYTFLHSTCILPSLLPGAAQKFFPCDLLPYLFFMEAQLKLVDLSPKTQRKELYGSYHFLALLLLPEIITQRTLAPIPNIEECIENTIRYFCNSYQGKFTAAEKECFKKRLTVLLQKYYADYLLDLPRCQNLIAAIFQPQQPVAAQGTESSSKAITPHYKNRRSQPKRQVKNPDVQNHHKNPTFGNFIKF